MGHIARECPWRGKGKGKGKAGEKGFGKAGGKEGWKGSTKGGGKGPADGKGKGKGQAKGGGKGYQGTCWRCWKVGHKAAECTVQLVGEASEEVGKGEEEEGTALGVWTVGSVEDVAERTGARRRGGEEARRPREEDRRRPRERTLGDWMAPMKVEVSNRFAELREEEEEETGLIGEVREEEAEEEVNDVGSEVGEVVEVTIDSGASRSVWPKTKRGVVRRKGGERVKLAAANGSPIEVSGEAALHIRRGKRKCAMRFLDADVRRPLGAVSAIVDEGNTVVFSKSGSFIQNDASGEKIRMVRKGGVFVVELTVEDPGCEGSNGGKKRGVKQIGAAGEEEGAKVFRRRA